MNVELLRMQRRIALHDDRFADHLFHFIQPASIVRLQSLYHFRMHAQQHIIPLQMLLHLSHLDINFVADRHRALHHACALADFAGNAQRPLQRLLHTFAGDRNQTKVVKLQTFDGARSALRASSRACITLCRFLRSSMSMKSMTMMPPRSRRRICRTISGMASRFVFRMVSSRRAVLPTYLPVLISMATSASV